MARYISLHPESQYTFRPNDFYRAQWSFLPDQERARIIATQLTYLEFHEWLDKNLRYHSPPESKRLPLEFDVKEGFVRTDVLLYGSICEAALYAVAKKVFDSQTTPKPPDNLLAAFETSEQKIVHLGDQTFTMEGDSPRTGCKIGMCFTKKTRKKDRDISFDNLIKAARSIGAIDDHLEKRLHALREARNTIHLGIQIAHRQKTGGRFYGPDRDTAKQVTEEMRKQLASYCKTQSLTA
jgi:hypothetical protein